MSLGVLFEELAARRIPIQYANKTINVFSSKRSYIPFKLNSAGVVPVIFASALISVPALIAQFSKNDGMMKFKGNMIFTSHDHQLMQTVANRIIDLKADKVIDREVTYNEYLGIE